jgi:hypothetical protein
MTPVLLLLSEEGALVGVGVPEIEAVVEPATTVTEVDVGMDEDVLATELVGGDEVAAEEVEATEELTGTLEDEDGTEEVTGGADEVVGTSLVVVVVVGGGGDEEVGSGVVVVVVVTAADVPVSGRVN